VPTVLIDADHPAFDRVTVDDEAGGRLATRFLIDLGHRRIAFLSDFLDTPFHPSMRQRYNGYRDALSSAGIPFRQEYHVADTHGRREARALAGALLCSDNPPTAIFAASDTQAIGVLDAARDLALTVPEELSVMGFDDIRDADYLNLTTVQQPLYESGTTGAEILLSLLGKEPNGEKINHRLPLTLVPRGTTAQPPGGRD
jgi:DNA-binding LacI/PurR family transcriptional regulator